MIIQSTQELATDKTKHMFLSFFFSFFQCLRPVHPLKQERRRTVRGKNRTGQADNGDMNNHSHETGWEWYLSEHLQGYRYIDHSIFDTTRIKMGNIWHVPEYIPTCLSWSTGFDQNTVEAHTQYALMTFTKLVRAHLWGYRLNPTTHNVATHLAQFQELPLLPGGNVMKDFLGQDSWATKQQQRSQILKRYVDVSLRTGPPGISFGPKKNGKSIIVHVSRSNLSNTKRQI